MKHKEKCKAQSPSPPLSPRVEPTQARAVETRESILEAAEQILEESGADGLTTKKAAERAGVRIRSVYRYFPNKLSIILALASRVAEKEEEFLGLYEELGKPENDWRAGVCNLLELLFREGKQIPGLRAIRAAMQVSPELKEIDAQMNRRHAKALSAAMQARGLDLPDGRLEAISETFVESATCLLDRAWSEFSPAGAPEKAELVMEEMKRLLLAYLETYL